MSEKFAPSRFFPLQAALFEASLAFLAVFLGWMFSQPPMGTVRVDLYAILMGILAVLPLLGLLVACRRVPWRPVLAVRRALDELIVPMFKNCTWSELAAISFLAGRVKNCSFVGCSRPRWPTGRANSCRTLRPSRCSATRSRSSAWRSSLGCYMR